MSPHASPEEVNDAFRRFALRHHPDRGGDPARFRDGADAYRRLLGANAPGRPAAGRSAPAEVVFHRRARPGIATLLRLAGHRLAAARPRR